MLLCHLDEEKMTQHERKTTTFKGNIVFESDSRYTGAYHVSDKVKATLIKNVDKIRRK